MRSIAFELIVVVLLSSLVVFSAISIVEYRSDIHAHVAQLESDLMKCQQLLDWLKEDANHLINALHSKVVCYDSDHMSAWDVIDVMTERLIEGGHPVEVRR